MLSIRALPGGLMPFRLPNERLILTFKLPKEMILAAKLRRFVKFYIAPLPGLMSKPVPALITAFFDNEAEPLICITPLCDDDLPRDLHELLGYDELEIYFFDEHNREWLGYRADLDDGGSIFAEGGNFSLPPPSIEAGMAILQHAQHWFSTRTSGDDERAITATFAEALYPEDIFILDARSVAAPFIGGEEVVRSSLVREDAGYFQEQDIAQGLRRVFPGDQIALNPIRRDDGKELADILVITDRRVVFIQAKDSPNTEVSLGRTTDRKLRTSRGQVEKAVEQSKGTAAFFRRNRPGQVTVGGTPLFIYLEDRELFAIVVFKEAFLNDGAAYVASWRDLEASGVKAVVLDYPAFDAFTHALISEDRLMAAFHGFRTLVLETGQYSNPIDYLFAITGEDRKLWAAAAAGEEP